MVNRTTIAASLLAMAITPLLHAQPAKQASAPAPAEKEPTVDAAEVAKTAKLQPLKYNNPGLTVDLGVGLWATAVPVARGNSGVNDLFIICAGKPKGGVFRFDNAYNRKGNEAIFKPSQRAGSAKANAYASYVDGKPFVLRPGEIYPDFLKSQLRSATKLPVTTDDVYVTKGRIRQNVWRYVDFDGDGVTDLTVGIEDWTDYGWDDAFNNKGEWTAGPLRGLVFVLRNAGTDDAPRYEKAIRLDAGGKPLETFGMPSPCFADYDGDGDLDLVCGEFVDKLTYFENVGTRTAPKYAAGKRIADDAGKPMEIDACMIAPMPYDWDGDGDMDLLVGGEDGRVSFVENAGKAGGTGGMPKFAAPTHLKQQADEVKFGVLVDPVPFDWDGDGDLDLLCGNAAGEIGLIENLSGKGIDAPNVKWADVKRLEAGGEMIRIVAGPNGSIQGPAEARWGYTTISVADWDGDGLPDILANSIWGKVIWYRNVGTRTAPKLAAAAPIEVAWPAALVGKYKPEWMWWSPEGNALATQWRTTPYAADVTGDGLVDLVMLDRDGFLSLFERRKSADGKLELLPPRHMFKVAPGTASVFDHNNKPLQNDADGDNKNDLAALDASGKLFFHNMQPQGTRELSYDKSIDRAGDPAYEHASADALRLTSGWAGRSGRRKFWLVDWDGDGDLDLLLNSQNVTLLRNIADKPGEFVFKDEGLLDTAILAGHDTSPSVGDFDGDGVPDLVVGAEDGYVYFMKNPSPKRVAGR
jgi:hypothetical protein